MDDKILEISNFSVSFQTYAGEVQAVRDISFSIERGEIVSIVGESGSGKSVMTQSIVKLLPSPPTDIKSGEIFYNGTNIKGFNFKQLQNIKGTEIAYIFQDPMTSLNPLSKVGTQVMEGILSHHKMSKKDAYNYCIGLLKNAGIPSAEKRMEQYPHELSGGMRQRVMIAIAIAMKPKLLIADEPTTALDVTTQSQILDTLKELNKEHNMSILLITHDMGIVAGMAQRVLVMYGGKIIESGSVFEIFEKSRHPYTRCLLGAVPRLDTKQENILEYIVGSPPDMINPGQGCPFAPRCKYSMSVCFKKFPNETILSDTHKSFCWLLHEGAKDKLEGFLKVYPDIMKAI